MSDKKRLIKYLIIFSTVFLFFTVIWFYKIYYNFKSAEKMLPVSLKISFKKNIFNKLKIYRMSPNGKIEEFSVDEENDKFYIDFGCYINQIKLVVDQEDKNEIELLKFQIGSAYYLFDRNEIKNRWEDDKNKSIIIFEKNDFKGLKKSIIPVFNKIINWPGGYSFFSVNFIIIIFIIVIFIGFISFFGKSFLKKYFPFIYNNKKIISIINFLIPVIIFNITYLQRYIYRSNQHTKFIHGLAKAGYGFLKNDWFANTIDPLPVFSFLVFFTYKFLHEYFFYLYQSILLGIFIWAILGISFSLFKIKDSKIKILMLFSLIILFHSQFIHEISLYLFKVSFLEVIYENGVAKQYLLGANFQPCVFGVFILLSIYYFLKNRPYIAVIFSAIAFTFHTGYVFFAGLLTLSYMIIILKDERDFKKAFLVGFLSLVLVSPVLIYDKIYFSATSPEIIKKAYDIIVNIRIPHHTDPRVWIDNTVYVKMIIITIAIFIVRKKKMFLILLLPFLAGIILTLVKLFTNSTFIGFLTPWRVSVFLVPLSTTIIFAYVVSKVFDRFGDFINRKEFTVRMICYIMILIPLLFGLNLFINRFNFYLNKDITPLERYVFNNKTSNDNYLVPVKYMEFRINTGAPVFVTYKSHPYKDVEILEWDERIITAEKFYDLNTDFDRCEMLESLKQRYGITHVVLTNKQFNWKLNCLEELYKDTDNAVYKIKGLKY